MATGNGFEQAAEDDPGRLLDRARRGDGAAFGALVRIFDPQLRGLAFSLLGSRELMDDVLQDAYVRAFRGLARFEARAQVSTWLHRIVYNACMDELRRARRRRWLPLAEPRSQLDRDPSPEPGERVVQASVLRAALGELSPAERAAVWLIDAQGYDYREAADVLGVPEGTVASRLARARGRLRAILAEERSS